MSTAVEKEYAKQLELMKWIDEHFKIELPADSKSILSITCFDLSIEHHAGICLLSNARLYGPMFALLRILFESCVRGLWLHYIANKKEIQEYKKDKVKIKFDTMVESVESFIQVDSGPLSSLKNNSWKLMNSFTHSGFQHLIRRNAEGFTGPINYVTAEVCSALNCAGTFGLLSAIELASFSGKQELVAIALQKAKEYAN